MKQTLHFVLSLLQFLVKGSGLPLVTLEGNGLDLLVMTSLPEEANVTKLPFNDPPKGPQTMFARRQDSLNGMLPHVKDVLGNSKRVHHVTSSPR